MDLGTYFRFVVALLFVLALIVVLAWAARHFGLGSRMGANAGKRKRLSIVEVAPLDGRNKLVLVKRDGVEHLLMLGHNDPLLVESGIRPREAGGDAPDGLPESFGDALRASGDT